MATQKALIIRAEGTIETIEYDDRDSLKTQQNAVGGTITSLPGVGNITAYCNDNAIAEQLPFNPIVSVGVRQSYPYGILGDVIFPKITNAKIARLRKLGFKI